MYWIVDWWFPCEVCNYNVRTFYTGVSLGDVSYLSRFYGTDVRGHVQNDSLSNFCYDWR